MRRQDLISHEKATDFTRREAQERFYTSCKAKGFTVAYRPGKILTLWRAIKDAVGYGSDKRFETVFAAR